MKKMKNIFNTLSQSQGIGKNYGRITKVKPFINRYNWEGINFPREKDDWKKLGKIMLQLLLMFRMLKKKKYILLMFQKTTPIVKNKLLF